MAQYLWDNYLGGQSDSRPLGAVTLDGIDFAIVNPNTTTPSLYTVLAKALKAFGDQVYLAAAPQCIYFDRELQDAINTNIFDSVWVQFYNNPTCEYYDGTAHNLLYNWRNWSNAPIKKLFLGLPASPEAATNGGFIPPETLISEVLPFINSTDNYGGVMLWCKYFDKNYSTIIRPYVVGQAENYITSYLSYQ